MENQIVLNRRKLVKYPEVKRDTGIAILFCAFVLLNVVKLSIFNFMIIYSKTMEVFTYKFVYTLLIGIIFYTIILRIRSRIPFLILYIVQMIYMFAYLSYFNYFQSYLHLFQATALLTESVGPIVHLSIPVNAGMLIILLDMPVFFYAVIKYPKLYSLSSGVKSLRRVLTVGALLLLICIEGWNLYNNQSIVQMGRNFFQTEPRIVERYGTIVNNITDVVFNRGGRNFINAFKYGKSVAALATIKDKPNIIAIQVESLDANTINKRYNGKYVAPFLHSLSHGSIYYPYTMSYHEAGGTSDSEFSIINSIEPLSYFPSIKISEYDYPNSFLKRLTKENYNTMAFHGNVAKFYSRDVEFPKMGFNEFDDINKMGFVNVGWGAPDDKVLQYAFDKMRTQQSPFFSYIITMSSHRPFTSADDYYHNKNYDDIRDNEVRNYFNSISYVDKSIEGFVNEVRDELPNTYILIWGDHTPDIHKPDYMQASFTYNNKYFEFVPLLIVTPDKKVYQEKKNVASFLDISPTILKAADINFEIKSNGINLIRPTGNLPKIPFKGGFYDRSELFKLVNGN